MGFSKESWRYPQSAVFDPTGTTQHAFTGVPLSVIDLLASDANTTGGIFSYATHFHSWEGPLTEASAGGWTLSGPTGTATIAAATTVNGEIVCTNDNTASAVFTLCYAPAGTGWQSFGYTAGKRMWAFAKLKCQTVASTELFLGFGTADTSPTTTGTFPSDGLFLTKAASDTDMTLHARKSGTSTTKATVLGTTLADATYTIMGFNVNQHGDLTAYLGGTSGLVAKTGSVIAAGDANLPTGTMAFMFGFLAQNKTVTLDWLTFGAEM